MKKIFSLISALAVMATMAVSVNAAATEPTLSLEVSSTGLKAGDTVTVVCKYDGYDVTPYDDGEGCGAKVTGAQIRLDIPGGIGTAQHGEMFLRPGVTNVPGFSTGAPQYNWDMNNNQFTFASSGIDEAMLTSGTAFTISMKLNKDVTEDLVFTLNADYEQLLVYDTYEWWEGTGTVMNPVKNLVSATLKAPVVEPEVPTKATKYAKLVAGDGSYVVIDLINGETIKDTAKLFLPAGVKGGEANVGIKFMFTAGVAADGKVAPAVGDVFKLYHVKDSNADAKTEIATFDVE